MATLSESLENFLSTLSEEEQTKYWKNYEEDFETKAACLLAGQEWNSEEESAAIRYLRNLKKRKELLVEKDKVGLSEVGAKRKRKLSKLKRIQIPLMNFVYVAPVFVLPLPRDRQI